MHVLVAQGNSLGPRHPDHSRSSGRISHQIFHMEAVSSATSTCRPYVRGMSLGTASGFAMTSAVCFASRRLRARFPGGIRSVTTQWCEIGPTTRSDRAGTPSCKAGDAYRDSVPGVPLPSAGTRRTASRSSIDASAVSSMADTRRSCHGESGSMESFVMPRPGSSNRSPRAAGNLHSAGQV